MARRGGGRKKERAGAGARPGKRSKRGAVKRAARARTDRDSLLTLVQIGQMTGLSYPTLLRDVIRSGPLRMARATAEVLRKDWRDKLPAITAPTLVIWGEHDRVCNPRIGEQIAAAVPGARLVIIRGAGHNPVWEKQAAFDGEVLGFLRG